MKEKKPSWRKARNLPTGTIVELVDGRVGMLQKNTGDPTTYWVKTSESYAVCVKPADRLVVVATTLDLGLAWLARYNEASAASKQGMVQNAQARPF